MDKDEQLAMQELHIKIIQCIEPSQLQDYLFQEKIVSEKYLLCLRKKSRVRTERLREFISDLKKHCPFRVFLLALRQENAYSFLAKELEGKLDEIKRHKRKGKSSGEIPWYEKAYCPIRRIQVFNENREEMVAKRHFLKRLLLNSERNEFDKQRHALKEHWLRLSKDSASNEENSVRNEEKLKVADLYFISLDAEIEYRRVEYDKTLFGDKVLIDMKSIIDKTSNPKVSLMLYLGRLASAMVMSDNRLLEDGLKAVQEAAENGERIEPCRETGIVLLIYYNLLSQQYELTFNQVLRENLIKMAKESLDHFAQERDDVYFDFRRIVLLKTSFIYLSIGLFCDILPVSVSTSQLTHAKSCLDYALRDWSRMEVRWKMIYHFAHARIHQIEQRWDLALVSVKESYRQCTKGKFSHEERNILKFLQYIKKRNG
ncbi:uncharacterized protein LOC133196352 [Saccostrea echinata]|uniref:uncharacterized protein LOC133196352 n=1 Tax=Saccostrea echinata TaxID=191078 RepID=UPI002A7F4047|nr:uncharacterized protein LOC133196352 [Saccostrea echinata]